MQMIAPGDRHVEPVAYDPKNLPERELIMEIPSAVTWLVACIRAVSVIEFFKCQMKSFTVLK